MTNEQIRARVRELIASDDLSNEPSVVQNAGPGLGNFKRGSRCLICGEPDPEPRRCSRAELCLWAATAGVGAHHGAARGHRGAACGGGAASRARHRSHRARAVMTYKGVKL